MMQSHWRCKSFAVRLGGSLQPDERKADGRREGAVGTDDQRTDGHASGVWGCLPHTDYWFLGFVGCSRVRCALPARPYRSERRTLLGLPLVAVVLRRKPCCPAYCCIGGCLCRSSRHER